MNDFDLIIPAMIFLFISHDKYVNNEIKCVKIKNIIKYHIINNFIAILVMVG